MRYDPIAPRKSLQPLSSGSRKRRLGDWKTFPKIDDNQATRTSLGQLPTDLPLAPNQFHQANPWMKAESRAAHFETLSSLKTTH